MATNEGQVPVAGGEKPRRRRKTMMPRRLSPTDEEQQWLGLSVKRPRTKVYVDAAVSVPATTTSKTSCNRQTRGPSMNIRDFHRAFLDTEVVMHWCMGRELLASCRTCLKCGEDMRLTPCPLRVTSDGFQWSCYRQSRGVRCRVKRSIRAGSWFSNSKLSLIEILELTYWWSHKLPESFVMREMRLGSSHTVVDWYNFCREVCEVYLLDHSQPVGGKQVEVEIFESKFGRWKHHQGHQAEGQWVFGGVEKGSTWKCFLVPVQKSDADSLVPLIEKWILPGSIVISDWCGSRDRLGEEGHERLTGKHGLVFKDCQTSSTCMTTIEDSWRHAKAGFPDYSSLSAIKGRLVVFLMPQEFQVLRCHKCATFQVQQVRKTNKWMCKMCGEKQSVIKVYGQGTGAECRHHVQKLNKLQGQMDEKQKFAVTSLSENTVDLQYKIFGTLPPLQTAAESKWTKFLDKTHQTSSADVGKISAEMYPLGGEGHASVKCTGKRRIPAEDDLLMVKKLKGVISGETLIQSSKNLESSDLNQTFGQQQSFGTMHAGCRTLSKLTSGHSDYLHGNKWQKFLLSENVEEPDVGSQQTLCLLDTVRNLHKKYPTLEGCSTQSKSFASAKVINLNKNIDEPTHTNEGEAHMAVCDGKGHVTLPFTESGELAVLKCLDDRQSDKVSGISEMRVSSLSRGISTNSIFKIDELDVNFEL